MSCYFCSEFNSSTDPQSRIIWEDDDFLVLPTMGCFTPGYCLLMPRDHVLSFANLPLDQLRGGLKVAEQWRGKIEKRFGQTVIAEHGAGECGLNGAACCDHAHLHLIPVHGRIGQVSRQYLDAGGSPTVLAEPEEVCRLSGAPYILLSPRPGQWWIWQELGGFQRQFVRRVCAGVLGIGAYSDWRTHTFKENMALTKSVLVERPGPWIHGVSDVGRVPATPSF